MENIRYHENVRKLIDQLLKNAAGIAEMDWANVNETAVETSRRIEAAREVNEIENVIGGERGAKIRRVTVEDLESGKVIYRKESLSGCLVTMETLKMTPDAKMIMIAQGIHQLHLWGEPGAWLHLIDTLKKGVSDKKAVGQICDALVRLGADERQVEYVRARMMEQGV